MNIDPCIDALDALRRDFKTLQSKGRLVGQVFHPVCIAIATKRNPYRFRIFCPGKLNHRCLPTLSRVYTQTISSSKVQEVIRVNGEWVAKK